MKKTGPVLVTLAMVLALLPAGTAQATGSLEATTSHTLVSPPVFDGTWMFAWQGEITGDIDGSIEWWIDTANWTDWENIVNNQPRLPISHYVEEVRVYDADGELLLKALNKGETNLMTTTWWANGTVTFADPDVFPGLEGMGVLEAGQFDLTTAPPSGISTFSVVAEPIVTGMVLVDAASDQDVGPLWPGTMIDLGTTPHFNIRVETAPADVGSVGFKLIDSQGMAAHRLDGKTIENFKPYLIGGDWPVGNALSLPLGMDAYSVTATAYTHGSLTGMAGPAYEVAFTVGMPFAASVTGTVLAIDTDPAAIAARCTADTPAWAIVAFTGSGEAGGIGPIELFAEHCSYIGPLPDGTMGPDGTYGQGMLTVMTADGDTILGTYTNGVTTSPPPDVTFEDSFSFSGGTGKFTSATGGGLETGTADFSAGFGPGAAFTVEMTGVISY